MRRPRLTPSRAGIVGLAAAALLVSGCGGGSDDDEASDDPSVEQTSEAPEETESPTPTPTPAPTPEPEPSLEVTDAADGGDLPGGVLMVGDKSVYLDGFFGVTKPEGWSVTFAEVPLLSVSPEGGETELDEAALAQSLVLNPDASPRGATFSLVHYEHSDSVPDLDRFSPAVVELFSGGDTQIGDPSEVTIGKQPGRLHQITSPSSGNGILVTLKAGPEYFFILALASDSAYAGEAAEMLSSVSMVPEALHS